METILANPKITLINRKKTLKYTQAVQVKRAVADQIELEMYRAKLNKNNLASRMGTSRAAVHRLLDPDNVSVTLGTLEKVAQALNKRLIIQFS